MGSTANRLIKNTAWLYAKMGITLLISLYTTRLILKGLGASDFGIYNIVGGAISMLAFLYSAMSSASQRFMNIAMGTSDVERIRSVFNVSVVLHICFALFFVVVLIIAGFFFFNGLLNIPSERIYAAIIVYICLIISTAFTVMTVPYDAVMNAHENMKYFALVGILESLLKLAIAVFVGFTSSDRLVFYGILMAFVPIANMIIMRVYCNINYNECRINIKKYFRKSLVKEMTSFAGWNFLTSVSSIIGQYGMGIIINNFYGVLLNAAQGIANQVSGVLLTFSNNAMKALNPILVKSEGAKDRAKVQYLSMFGCRLSFFIISLFSVPVILDAPIILRIWLTEVPEWAVVFCQLQLVRIILDQLTSSLASAVYAQGNIKNYTIFKSISNILPIIITPILFYYGCSPVYMYYTWIICWNIVGGVILIYYAWKLVDILPENYFYKVLCPAIISCMFFIFPYVFTKQFCSSDKVLFLVSLVSVIPFLISSWFLLFSVSERITLVNIIKSKLK